MPRYLVCDTNLQVKVYLGSELINICKLNISQTAWIQAHTTRGNGKLGVPLSSIMRFNVFYFRLPWLPKQKYTAPGPETTEPTVEART